MSKFCVNSHAHRALALSLAFAVVLFCCSGFFFSASADYTDETFIEIMEVILDSWGVNFSKPSGDTTSIEEYTQQLLDEYLLESQMLQDDFFRSWQIGADKLGHLIGNNYLVSAVLDFVNWLIGKYDLQDNSRVTIGNQLSFAYVGTALCIVIYSENDLFLVDYIGESTLNYNCLARVLDLDSSTISYPFYLTTYSYPSQSQYSHPAIYSPTLMKSVRIESVDTSPITFLSYSGSRLVSSRVWQQGRNLSIPGITPLVFDHWPSAEEIFGDYTITPVSSPSTFYIDTREIDIPTIDPSSGIEITVPGANWGDTVSDILDLVERLLILYDDTQIGVNSIIGILADLIENLQDSIDIQQDFVLLSPDLSDISIPSDSAWGVVSGVFDSFSEGLSLLSFLVFSLPSAFWVLFTAIFCFIFVYVFIKMGRDSH